MKWIYWFYLLVISTSTQANIYKYQDENGRWHYTDKQPVSKNVQTIQYKSTKTAEKSFKLFSQVENGQTWLMAENQSYAPMQLSLKTSSTQKIPEEWVVQPKSIQKIQPLISGYNEIVYATFLGAPNLNPVPQHYSLPIDTSLCPSITQAFNGKFSHQSPESRYAVDIGTDVGTEVKAAQAGVVIGVKDDYALGGTDEYFIDKANYIQILHQDGTWAIYAHILMGSAKVRLGEQVEIGHPLAKTGSSGYSSGPHLHFVIQKNGGLKVESIPFEFISSKSTLTPSAGQNLCKL